MLLDKLVIKLLGGIRINLFYNRFKREWLGSFSGLLFVLSQLKLLECSEIKNNSKGWMIKVLNIYCGGTSAVKRSRADVVDAGGLRFKSRQQ